MLHLLDLFKDLVPKQFDQLTGFRRWQPVTIDALISRFGVIMAGSGGNNISLRDFRTDNDDVSCFSGNAAEFPIIGRIRRRPKRQRRRHDILGPGRR